MQDVISVIPQLLQWESILAITMSVVTIIGFVGGIFYKLATIEAKVEHTMDRESITAMIELSSIEDRKLSNAIYYIKPELDDKFMNRAELDAKLETIRVLIKRE